MHLNLKTAADETNGAPIGTRQYEDTGFDLHHFVSTAADEVGIGGARSALTLELARPLRAYHSVEVTLSFILHASRPELITSGLVPKSWREIYLYRVQESLLFGGSASDLLRPLGHERIWTDFQRPRILDCTGHIMRAINETRSREEQLLAVLAAVDLSVMSIQFTRTGAHPQCAKTLIETALANFPTAC